VATDRRTEMITLPLAHAIFVSLLSLGRASGHLRENINLVGIKEYSRGHIKSCIDDLYQKSEKLKLFSTRYI
jgi:hypothetical protein